MPDVMFNLIIVLGVVNVLTLFYMIFSPFKSENLLDTLIYLRIFKLKNVNIVGKILLTILATPISLVAQLFIIVCMLIVVLVYYVSFVFTYIFAVDRQVVVDKWLDPEFIQYLKDRFRVKGNKNNNKNEDDEKH